jgi:hypothetical protein
MRNVVIAASLLLLLLFACRKSESVMTTDTASAEQLVAPVAPPRNAADRVAGFSGPQAQAPPPAAVPSPRMIVRTASLSLIVNDAMQAMHIVTDTASQLGGYVTDAKEWRENEQLRGTITVRVPSNRFDEMIGSAKKSAVRIQSETRSGQDVTQEFSDLGANLRNAEAAEVELRELLTTVRQRTQKAAEVLEVYEKLNEVRGQIEQLKGRMQYLSQVTAMSSVTFELIPDVLAQPVVEQGWRPRAVAHRALRALVATLQWLGNIAIWLVLYIVPVLLVLLLAILPIRALWPRIVKLMTRPL